MLGRHKDMQGFSAVVILVVVVVVGLVALSGYFVYKDQTVKPVAVSPVSNINIAKTPTLKYLSISQWGVRAPYSGSDTLSYRLSRSGNYTVIVSQNMAQNYGCTGTNNEPSGAGIISRSLATATASTPTPETYAQLARQDPKDNKQIGEYVYSFAHDQAACSNKTLVGTPGEKAQINTENFTNSLISKLETI